MELKIGDNVAVIDENTNGRIVDIKRNMITVLDDETGFETDYEPSELIRIQSFEVEHIVIKDGKIRQPKINKEHNPTKEIDLHIGHLVDFTKGLSNAEILAIQKQTIRNEIALATNEKRKRIIFIHGHGKGVLKRELYNILDTHKNQLHYFDADFKRFKLGATEVEFFKT